MRDNLRRMDLGGLAGGRARTAAVAVEAFLHRWAPLLLVATALVYYGLYYRTGLNLGGEGGCNAVLAMRLMEGQRPIVDTFLGYNLLWFYPLVALFHVTGPDYVAMRIFFFALSTVTALLGFLIVRDVTRKAWLAAGTGLLLVLVPGMMFRNYMGFIGVLSMFVLLKGYVLPARSERRQLAWMTATGGGLAVCFLLRIEPSLLLSVIWAGLAVLHPLGQRTLFLKRLRVTLLGTLLGVFVLTGIHGVVTLHACQRGFGRQFLEQYSGYANLLRYELFREVDKLRAATAAMSSPAPETTTPANIAPVAAAAAATPVVPPKDDGREARLARPALLEIWEAPRPRDRFLGLCFYYPVFWSAILVPIATGLLAAAVLRGDDSNKSRSLVVLTTTGCALTLFPQYFFFRPDAPHLSEFMVPFLPAVACSASVLWQASREARSALWRRGAWVLVVASALLVPIYMKAIMPREEAGTIIQHGELAEFEALNNVRVKVSPEDAVLLAGLRDAVLGHSAPGEYVVCYPYSPTINFMTDRPSYEYDLYVDDTVSGPRFEKEAIERIGKFRPAVIVIDNRAINRTERSRFKSWAASLTAHIASNYRLVGSFWIGRREIEVYARPDKTGTPAGAP